MQKAGGLVSLARKHIRQMIIYTSRGSLQNINAELSSGCFVHLTVQIWVSSV